MAELTIDVGSETALFLFSEAGSTEQYKIPTGEGFSLDDLNQQIADLESDYQLQDYRLALAFPGMVRDHSLVSCKHLPGLAGQNLQKLHTKGTLEVVCNDVQAAMHAVTSNKYACELLVMCSEGMGLALSIHGKVFTGANGLAGDLGNCWVMTESGEFTLEQMASGESIRQRRLRNPVELYRSGAYLGMGIAWAINLFNPQHLWLAGSTIANADYYKGCVANIREMVSPAMSGMCQISRVDDSETLVCRGLMAMLSDLNNA
ncbi:ROK family protein [Shewanella sp. A32]|uniref:ROK family protein n=1 Tax=Shewanella sp. A32 TaxID=3031327 RepID=UPI0023B9CD3B|nr:ROK family protein [Shewanella sp. A32]MDF0533906.1 ROK family protein [Shewanella sp. A32]